MGGGGGGGDDTQCDKLSFKAHLTSANAKVIKSLKAKDVMEVKVRSGSSTVIVAVTEQGDLAGAITSGRHAKLLSCLKAGYEFKATVLAINGGDCEVEVRPRA